MRAGFVFAGLLVCSIALGAENRAFDQVQYMKPASGSEKAATVKGKLAVDGEGLRFDGGKSATLVIQRAAIKNLLYERASKPRYAAGILLAWPLLFTKSKAHWLTVQQEGGYAMFRLDKGNCRQVLAAVEAATGLKIERQEER
jgi:hypothetical protein